MSGEVREAIYDESAGTWVVGDRLAMQGAEGCCDVRCTQINGRCVGWHCPRCGAPCSSQGHDCQGRGAMATDLARPAEPSYPSCRLPGCQEPARTSTGFSSEYCEERYFDMARDAEEEQ